MLSDGDSVRAKWADEWCLGRFCSAVSETRGCYEIVWDNGSQNAIPVADVQRFEQRFKCRHAHHPDFRAAPAGMFKDYECVVTDHDAVASVSCETCGSLPCARLCGRWFEDEAARAEHVPMCRGDQAPRARDVVPPPPKRARAGRVTEEKPGERPAKKRASGGAPRGRGAPAAAGRETVRSARPEVGDAVEVGWANETDGTLWAEAVVEAHDAGGFVVTYAGTDERVAHGLVFGDLGEGEKTAILLDFLRHMEEADVAGTRWSRDAAGRFTPDVLGEADRPWRPLVATGRGAARAPAASSSDDDEDYDDARAARCRSSSPFRPAAPPRPSPPAGVVDDDDDGLGDGRRVVIRGRRLAGLQRDKPLSLAQIKAISRVVFDAEERERKAAGATDEEATRAARRVSNKAVRSAKAPRPSRGADAALERAVAEAIGDEGAASLLLGAAGLQAILDELELPPSQRQKLIRSGGKPRGCTLGVTSRRDGTCVLANATDLLDSLLPQALNAYFRARAPREARDAFVSSIQVNRYDSWRDAATPHVDRNNLGPSWIIAFGDFEGGELWVEGAALDAADAFRSFDGRDFHATLPFSGGPRYSLVFYCVASHARLGKSDRDAAELLGFRLPPPGAAPPPRREATRGMGLDAATRAFDAAARAHDDYPHAPPAAAAHPFG